MGFCFRVKDGDTEKKLTITSRDVEKAILIIALIALKWAKDESIEECNALRQDLLQLSLQELNTKFEEACVPYPIENLFNEGVLQKARELEAKRAEEASTASKTEKSSTGSRALTKGVRKTGDVESTNS